jgi:hypothetical protein
LIVLLRSVWVLQPQCMHSRRLLKVLLQQQEPPLLLLLL